MREGLATTRITVSHGPDDRMTGKGCWVIQGSELVVGLPFRNRRRRSRAKRELQISLF